jgi:hypothetical protein
MPARATMSADPSTTETWLEDTRTPE